MDTSQKSVGLIGGVFMLGIGFLVHRYPEFFLEWGKVNTIKALVQWGWFMMIAGAVLAIICGLLFFVRKSNF